MNTPARTQPNQSPSALALMAARYNVDPVKLHSTLQETVFKGATPEQCLALVVVANQYGLNPFTREIYAFHDRKSGGIVPVISVDGRINMMQNHPQFDGIEFAFDGEGGDLSCTATIHRKDRKHPFSVTEYLSECRRETDPWKTAPRRMLRHKALIQACRVAFAFGGIGDEDDVVAMAPAAVSEVVTITQATEPAKEPQTLPTPEQLPAVAAQNDAANKVIAAFAEAGISIADFREWCERGQRPVAAAGGGIMEWPPEFISRIAKNLGAVVNQIKAMKEEA